MSSLAGATGILGGTFDPVHRGHVAVAAELLSRLALAEVRMVPAFRPPHREPPRAPALDRLAMTRLAVAGIAGLVTDDIEVRREGVSYTVDTLAQLRASGLDRLVLLVGMDAAVEMGSWHRAQEIAGLAEVVVFNRTGTPVSREQELPVAGQVVEVDSPDVSATRVRESLEAGGDADGMLPASVLEYIRVHGLYSAQDRAAPEHAVIIRPQ